ncbi:MAG: bifunctional phosphoribosylaminoimidazolecarboxamide formyltransferase/IMP cyclohydrolase [Candidatus Omnitrophica bacterium]|nr:bifunctional phosphoribosylaminoimidazolecarboxamide formyltransferase/IMP cyclohydrolase [Candidatus Omnitrophota bacterium]
MTKITRALMSVTDKTGLVDLARTLKKFNVEILSTGGTAKVLRDNGIAVTEVSDYTGFPEMLDGRVKTLHPKIHGGLLALRDNDAHMQKIKECGIGLIDMVVVNLYPFQQVIQKQGVTLPEAIENIDIGGPSMLRSAAKNNRSVAVVSSPSFYAEIIRELERNDGALSQQTLFKLAVETFNLTWRYDQAIARYLGGLVADSSAGAGERLTAEVSVLLEKVQDLRYGENPHQKGAFYRFKGLAQGLSSMKQLSGKELSFNNILDVNAATGLVREFKRPAVVFIKHNNPCGAAENDDILKAYRDAWKSDKLSAFGGIVSINRKVTLPLARLIEKSGFLECVVCPGFAPEALEILKVKKNLRLLDLPFLNNPVSGDLDYKKVNGGMLLQEEDTLTLNEANLKVVTRKKPTKAQMQSLLFAWKVAKHVKSNAIVLTRGTRTVGIGAGQMSRVDSVYIATKKSGKLAAGSVLASDAFFPKDDAIKLAAKHKITAIIQPGGSIADKEIIRTADKCKIAMVTTGIRHFRH